MIPEENRSATTLEDLIGLKREALRVIGQKVESGGLFSLATPVALIRGMEVEETAVGSLASKLPCSSALCSPELTRYMSLAATVGTDAAFTACTEDDGEGGFGDRFVAAWDAAAADLKKGVVMSTRDLVDIVQTAKEGAESDPKQVLVVWRRADEANPGNDHVSYALVQISSL